MKIKFVVCSTVLATALSLPVLAGTDMKQMVTTPELRTDAGFYAAIYGGAQFDTDYGNQRQTLSGTPASATAIGVPAGTNITPSSNFNAGWGGVGGVKLGYNFQSYDVCDSVHLQPAVEAEGLYLGTTSTMSASALGYTATGNTSYNSAAWFVNGILRFKNSSIVTPYIGFGVGGEYLTIHSDMMLPAAGIHATGITGSDVDFAGQALAGLDVALANHWSLFSEYKFIDAIGTDIKSANIAGTGLDYRFKPDQLQQHLIVAGLKYNF